MKNYEKYKDAIIDFLNNANCRDCTRNCDECILSMLEEKLGVYTRYELEQWLKEEYKEPIQLSNDEYVILKNLDSKWKWIVRHDNGKNLWLFVNRPTKEGYCIWVDLEEYDDEHFDMFNHLFQFIKWEDEEPYEIAKLIEDYEKENGDVSK